MAIETFELSSDYGHWTRDELIARIRVLEGEVRLARIARAALSELSDDDGPAWLPGE